MKTLFDTELKKKIRQGMIVAGLALGCYLFLVLIAEEAVVIDAMLSLPWQAWLLVALLSFVNYATRMIRWHFFLRELDTRLTWHVDALAYFSGFALTATPAKVGEALRCVLLANHEVPYSRSMATCLIERMLDLVIIVLLAAPLLILGSDYAWFMAVGLLLVVVVAFAVVKTDTRAVLRFLPKFLSHRLDSSVDAIDRLLVQARGLLTARVIFYGSVLGGIGWAAEGVGLYLILDYLGAEQPLVWTVAVYATASLVGAITFMPGGLGTSEAALIVLLTASGMDFSVATAATLICRALTLWLAIALGIVCLLAYQLFGISPSNLKLESQLK